MITLNNLIGRFRLPRSLIRILNGRKVVLEAVGHCPTCQTDVRFVATDPWLRDHLLCPNCRSKPRERALMTALETYFPNWQQLTIHESSPIDRGASVRLARECAHYVPSQYYPDEKPGAIVKKMRCENLEALTFDDNSVDIHITQDVMEHVLSPSAVFREIARTLRPGGAHVFTVPIVNKHKSSAVRARKTTDGSIEHLLPAVYHGNPLSKDGALVTIDWGYDICRHIFEASGLFTHIFRIDDLSKGIRAEYIEVLITIKPADYPQADPIP